MYDTFLKTGKITEVLAGKITELGGNLEAFQKYADLSAGLAPRYSVTTILPSALPRSSRRMPDIPDGPPCDGWGF
jgi:hypothetical protein